MKQRKVVTKVMAALMAISVIPNATVEATTTKVVWGDVNLNGEVDATDAQATLARFLEDTLQCPEESRTQLPYNFALGDVDGNGKITATDAQDILRKYLETILGNSQYYFEVESPIRYQKIVLEQKWDLYSTMDNLTKNFYGIAREGEVLEIVSYHGNNWYLAEDLAGNQFYMNIPSDKLNVDISYVGETSTSETTATTTTTEVTTTTTESTTVPTETHLPETTTVTEATTTTTTTTTTEATTTTTTMTTTTTTATTTTETTTTDSIKSFDVGSRVKFNAVSWILYANNATENRIGYLLNGQIFQILSKSRYTDSYRYVVRLEHNNEEAVIYIKDTSYFEVL